MGHKSDRERDVCSTLNYTISWPLQEEISSFKKSANDEIEVLDQVEEARKREVPRLKSQLSLYATTTNIKWDYDDSDMISGTVVSSLARAVAFTLPSTDADIAASFSLLVYLVLTGRRVYPGAEKIFNRSS